MATEAIRQASNSAAFLEQVQSKTNLTLQLISGTAEAALTFFGATYEVCKEPDHPAQIGVMDLGGGSLELVTARNMRINGRTSIPIGSGWLHDRFLSSDPPIKDSERRLMPINRFVIPHVLRVPIARSDRQLMH